MCNATSKVKPKGIFFKCLISKVLPYIKHLNFIFSLLSHDIQRISIGYHEGEKRKKRLGDLKNKNVHSNANFKMICHL
jgi:hypothetical protein